MEQEKHRAWINSAGDKIENDLVVNDAPSFQYSFIDDEFLDCDFIVLKEIEVLILDLTQRNDFSSSGNIDYD